MNQSLSNVEKGFDEVFQKIINDTYYSKTFSEKYNEIMPEKFSELEESIRNELKK